MTERMSDATVREFEFEIWQDGIRVVQVSAPTFDKASREIWHYAMVYGQDGPVDRLERKRFEPRPSPPRSLPTTSSPRPTDTTSCSALTRVAGTSESGGRWTTWRGGECSCSTRPSSSFRNT
jgi:hypothetical protein